MKQVFRRVIDRRGRVEHPRTPRAAHGPGPGAGAEPLLADQLRHRVRARWPRPPWSWPSRRSPTPGCATSSSRPFSSTGMAQTARRVWHEMITPAGDRLQRRRGRAWRRRERRGLQGRPDRRVRGDRPRRDRGTRRSTTSCRSRTTSTCGTPAFVTVGGIAMQALRRADLQFGETVAIYGLGLVGQLAARIAQAAGCVVVGIDVNPKANELALESGCVARRQPQRPGLEAADPRLHRQARRRRDDHLRQLGLLRDRSTPRWRSPADRAGS